MNKIKHKSRSKRNELQYSTAEVILPSAILLIAIIVILFTIINAVIPLANRKSALEEQIKLEEEVWRQAYLEVEKEKVGVIFEPIKTSEEKYKQLQEACDKFIETEFSSDTADANIDVDTVISEKLYIDNNSDTSVNKQDTDKNPSETGPIYLQDMLMVRYINSTGLLKVVTAVFNNNNEIKILEQSDIANRIKEETGSKGSIDLINNLIDDTDDEMNNDFTTEIEYLSGVSDTLHLLLTASTIDEIRAADSAAMNYFTYEGKQTVFDNKDQIKLSQGASIKTLFIEAGKSNTSKSYKDRIYTQQEITLGDTSVVVNIVLKLNSNLRIFDIDIL